MYRSALLMFSFALVVCADSAGVKVDPGGPLVHRGSIDYPEEINGHGIEGTVALEVSLDKNGEVKGVEVLSGPLELARVVMRSVLDWHYSSNKTLPAKVRVTVSFHHSGPMLPPPEFRIPESAQQKVQHVIVDGLSASSREVLQARLPVRVGDRLTPESAERARRAVFEFDPHLVFSVQLTDLGYTIRVTAPGATQTPEESLADSPAPKLLSSKPAKMPALAKQAGISGVVQLKVKIGTDGHVKDISVESGHPLLVPSSMAAVKSWVYEPTIVNDKPVEVTTRVELTFSVGHDVAVLSPSGPTPQ